VDIECGQSAFLITNGFRAVTPWTESFHSFGESADWGLYLPTPDARNYAGAGEGLPDIGEP
jgi:hypothetical protein